MITIPQRHRQTDGQTTCLGNPALRVASRGNNTRQIKLERCLTLFNRGFITEI